MLLNIETIGFQGDVWGVNPSRDEVLGHPCVPSIADLPVAVDAVVVAIPAAAVPPVIDQAGARGCGGAVVISAGFGEVAEGVALNEELVAAAARYGLPVCGPNCNGIVAPATRTALWGDALAPQEAGAVALVSQSGNVAVNALATRRGLRFHTVIASGNQAVLSAADYLEFLAAEEGSGAIALYLEDDGGPRFCDGLVACARGQRPGDRAEGRDSRAPEPRRPPPTAPRSRAISGSSAASSRRRAASGPTMSTTCSSSPRRSRSRARRPAAARATMARRSRS